MNTITAPDLSPGYPSKGAKLGAAWDEIWTVLSGSQDFQDGRVLADRIAPKHDLAPATLVALMSRMAKGGILERELRNVNITMNEGKQDQRDSRRLRTHYRIKA